MIKLNIVMNAVSLRTNNPFLCIIPLIFLYLVFIISPKLLKLVGGFEFRKGSLDLERAIVIKWKTAPNIAPPT